MRKKRALLSGIIICLLMIGGMPGVTSAFAGRQLKCERKTVPVTLSPADTTQHHIVGWLCAKGNYAHKTVQVLLPGLTYDHTYWDFPYKASKYSYVQRATSNGYATFNIDRLGTGESAKPSADKVTFPAQAYIAQQLVEGLKQGTIANHRFEKVVGVGHSMGAAIWLLATQYSTRVDALVLTDYLHQANPPVQAQLGAARYPAKDDPKFALANLPEGYITTRPDTRYLYYNVDFADPRVISWDEQLKQTNTTGEITTIGEARAPEYSLAVTVPVLLVVGEKDSLFCDKNTAGLSCRDAAAVKARESAFYSQAARMKALVVPGAGHDTNLHYNAPGMFSKVNNWIGHTVRQ